MCAMMQKLRMNFGSIRVCYRLQFFPVGLSTAGHRSGAGKPHVARNHAV
jgi:hypothetical protein